MVGTNGLGGVGGFGSTLRRLRRAAGFTQEELARRTGLSIRGISDLERGARAVPRQTTLWRILDAFALAPADRATLVTTAGTGLAPFVASPPPSHDGSLGRLPTPLTSFVGREREVDAAVALIRHRGVRLLTLTGPGGVGKTRLALRIAEELRPDFDGICIVPLAAIRDPALVLPTMAWHLGVSDAGAGALAERLRQQVRAKQLLFVLDNVEQVLAAVPEIVDVLKSAPGARALLTSRILPRAEGEHAFPVLPLTAPPPTVPMVDAELLRYPAVRLFLDRATAICPDFALTADNASSIAELCKRLDGLPLAIELATAWIRIFPPATLLARLERRLPLLTGGPSYLPERQQTLRGTIDWSHDLLDPDEQALFRRLAVFSGGFTLEAADFVCGGQEPGVRGQGERDPSSLTPDSRPLTPDVLDGIASLVDKSLLRVEEGSDEGPRFTMLETVREYGLEQLVESGEKDEIRERHATYVLALAEAAEVAWDGPDQARWLDRLEHERDNLRTALTWLDAQGDPAPLVRLAGALSHFWTVRGSQREGRRWLDRALERRDTPPSARTIALVGACQIAHRQDDLTRAQALADELVTTTRAGGDRLGHAIGLFLLSQVANRERAHGRATTFAAEAVACLRALGDQIWLPWALQRLGLEAYARGDHHEATALIDEALCIWRGRGDTRGIVYGLTNLGMTRFAQGDRARAAELFREALALCGSLGDRWGTAELVALIGAVAGADGELARAARLIGSADAICERTGFRLPPVAGAIPGHAAAVARESLGAAAFASAWDAGRMLTMDQAIAEAIAEPAASLSSAAPTAGAGLTSREEEVLRLLAEGDSNRAIADTLFISLSTVKTHLTSIFSKLEVDSRAAAVAYAHRHGLDEPESR